MKPLQLHAGAYYRRRDGEIVGPCEPTGRSFFAWEAHGCAYLKDGRWCHSGPDSFDLIAEVPAPGTKPKRAKAKRETVVRWCYWGFTFPDLKTVMGLFDYETHRQAVNARRCDMSAGMTCGPIVRIESPAPKRKATK